MPSPDTRSADLTVEVFGGRVTQFGPQALPMGASPFNQDVIFSDVDPIGVPVVGETATRPGMQSLGYLLAGLPSVLYLRTFVDSQQNFRQLYLDAIGNLTQDFPQGSLSVIGTAVPGSYGSSDTLFGREWLSLGALGFGVDIPRQWDGTFYDRVSQVGPGAPPNVTDDNTTLTTNTGATGVPQMDQPGAAVGITSITQSGNVVTVQPASITAFFELTGEKITIAGVTPAAYNGTFAVTWLPNGIFTYTLGQTGLAAGSGGTAGSNAAAYNFLLPAIGLNSQAAIIAAFSPLYYQGLSVTVTGATVAAYNGTFSLVGVSAWFSSGKYRLSLIANIGAIGSANATGGSMTFNGNVGVGAHQVAVSFITREGYYTRPSPPATWNAAGGKRALLTQIPIGPQNVVGRLIIFTPVITAPATTGPFFYFSGPVPTPSLGTFPSMILLDNVTTTLAFDFTDAILEAGTAATNLFNLTELGECSGNISYSSRTLWWGERNKVPNFNNLSFQGGFGTDTGGNQYPLGWTEGLLAGNPNTSYGGKACFASGDTPYWNENYEIVGDGSTFTVGAIYQSAFQDYLGVQILQPATSYSIRVRVAKNSALTQGNLLINLASAQVTLSTPGISLNFNQVTTSYAEYTALLTTPLSSIPSDLSLQVFASGTPSNGGKFFVACIEVFPTLVPNNLGQLRVSYALQPEAIDGVTGNIQVEPTNGQAVRSAFRLLDNKLYIVKERSLWNTTDDGQNEAALWTVNQVSDKVGTASVHGVDTSPDGWAVIASKDGLYIFDGGTPTKISQEIQTDWDQINWGAAYNMYVTVNHIKRRIHVGVPTGRNTLPNMELVLDYAQLNTSADIADSPQAHYAYFNPTQIVAPGRARRWTVWNISMASSAMTIRSDGSYHHLRGNATNTGKIYEAITGQLSDDGAAINSQYQTAYFPSTMQEQQLQLGAHGKLFQFLSGFVSGVGSLSITAFGQNNQRAVGLVPLTLSPNPQWDFEKNANHESERFSLLLGTNAVGSWFHLSRLTPVVKKSVTRFLRGRS